MTELSAALPLAGLDRTHGMARLTAIDPGRLTWLAPWPGTEGDLSATLEASHGLPFPEPGCVTQSDTARCLWAGRSQAVLIGPDPAPALDAHGAVTDVTEVWAGLRLTGAARSDVLARLVPLDLRPSALPQGRTVRSLLGHMMVQLTPTDDGMEILVMRSFAETAAHEIDAAMRRVAARGPA